MRVTLLHTGVRDAGEFGVVQRLNGGSTAVAHARAKTAHELVDHLLHTTFEGNATGDAFGHQLLHTLHTALEIAVFRAVFHGFERAHATISLELTTVEYDGFAGAFLASGHERTDHHAVSACGQSFHHIARIAESAVGNEGHTGAFESACHVVDCGELRHADAGHHACGANRSRTNAHFYRVGTGVNEHFGCFARGDIPHHDVDVGIFGLGFFELLHYSLRMSVCRVDHNGIDAGIDEGFNALHRVYGYTYAGGYAQTPLGVFACHGFVFGFCDVLISNESDEASVGIHHGEFFNLVLLQYLACAGKVGRGVGRHKVITGHHFVDGAVEIVFEAQIAIGHNAHELHVIVHNRDTSDVILGH